jgi:hypothetical protein
MAVSIGITEGKTVLSRSTDVADAMGKLRRDIRMWIRLGFGFDERVISRLNEYDSMLASGITQLEMLDGNFANDIVNIESDLAKPYVTP